MLSSALYVIVMVMLVTDGSKASTCSLDEEIFQFSISSKRNATHYRILQVDLTKGVKGTSNNSGDIILDVDYGRSMSSNGELFRLHTSITGYHGHYDTAKHGYSGVERKGEWCSIVSSDDNRFCLYATDGRTRVRRRLVLEPPLRRDDYELFPGIGYYKLHTTAQPWEAARAICMKEGAHLIVINSDVEADVVKEYFSREPTFTGTSWSDYVYAGFHDKYTEGHYATVTGVSVAASGYTKWAPRRPVGTPKENFGGLDSHGRLHDIPNEWKLGFICEQEL